MHTNTLPSTSIPRVALYARCSAQRQAEKELSIPAQLDALRETARARGWEVSHTFIDEAESASSADRPRFQEMLSLARARPRAFDKILVWKLSRFSRSREDSVLYKAMLRRAGVELVSLHEPVDDSPAGRMLEGILEAVDEFYIDNLSQDTVRGMRKNASLGFLNGGAIPTGYRPRRTGTEVSPKRVLEPDPCFAPLIQRIFRMALEGQGSCEIAATLHREGLKTRTGLDWTKGAIMLILRNEAYTGVLRWGLTRTGRQRHRPADPVRREEAHPPLVSREDFDQVQAILAARQPQQLHPRQAGGDYLLTGLLRCRACGSIYIGHPAKSGQVHYYGCQKKMKTGARACPSRLLNRERADAAVLQTLQEVILVPSTLKALVDEVAQVQREQASQSGKELEGLEEQVQSARKKLQRLYEALEDGTLELSELAPRIRARKEELEKLEARRQVLKETVRAVPVLREEQVVAWVQSLRGLLSRVGASGRKLLLRSWIQEIEVEGMELTIQYALPDSALPGREGLVVKPEFKGGDKGKVRFEGGRLGGRSGRADGDADVRGRPAGAWMERAGAETKKARTRVTSSSCYRRVWLRSDCPSRTDDDFFFKPFASIVAQFDLKTVARIVNASTRKQVPRFRPKNQSVLTQARSWSELMQLKGFRSATELADHLGVTRARVAQVMSILKARPEVLEIINGLQNNGIDITERRWRILKSLQLRALKRVASSWISEATSTCSPA